MSEADVIELAAGPGGVRRAEALRAHVAQLPPERVAPMDRGAAFGRLII